MEPGGVREIGNVARDKVASLEFHYLISGGEPEAGTAVVFDFDGLELEAVEPDYVEGWGIWPGRVAYSHTGYSNGGVKTALASGLAAREFRLVDQETGETVLTKPVRTVSTRLGGFQVMDFSEVRRTGSYVLEAGGPATRPFRIEPERPAGDRPQGAELPRRLSAAGRPSPASTASATATGP